MKNIKKTLIFKVPLNDKPWRHKWDRKSLKGVIYPPTKRFEYERYLKSTSDFKPHERWDLMKHYRETIQDHDQKIIEDDLRKYELDSEDNQNVVTSTKKLIRTRKIPGENNNK